MTGTGSQGNALSEVALALAMVFFSVMVLALVSMGGAVTDAASVSPAALPEKPTLKIAASNPATSDPAATGKTARTVSKTAMLIFHRGRYLDAALKPVDPQSWRPAAPAVLAIAPSTPLVDILAAKARLTIPDLTITTLDDNWLKRLKELN